MSKTETKVIRRKKKSEEQVDAPSEVIAPAPVNFVTMQEILEATSMMPEEDEEDSEPDVDESPSWTVDIDGLQRMEAYGTKFSVFTTGENSSGQMVIEIRSKPGVNSSIFGWLQKPVVRKIRMEVVDHEGNKIERWEMNGTPVAMAVDELDTSSRDPWITTLQVDVKSIKVN